MWTLKQTNHIPRKAHIYLGWNLDGVCPRRDPHISRGMFSEGNPYGSSVETLIRFYIQKEKKITIFYPLKNNQNTIRGWKGGGGQALGKVVSYPE